ncbi:HmuY family protein [Marinobacter salicampi]|uniref:HmuY family protein n=1 Tax=Marinobacter salicampi TaxID=435907 RepID=UPI001409B557|nr:HmuY family protein [Marinobacter salicampi]
MTIPTTSLMRLTPALALLLAACGGGSSNEIEAPAEPADSTETFIEKAVSAQDASNPQYLNLETGDLVDDSGDWHMAFARTTVQLNGGASGSGSVAGALGAVQDDFYDASGDPVANVFLNATADSELEHLAGEFARPDRWIFDSVGSEFGNDWYVYNFQTHEVSANDTNGWLIRSGEGNSYARVRVEELAYQADPRTFRLAFNVQPENTSQFTTDVTWAGTIPEQGGDQCYDFDSGAEVACDGALWDLKLSFGTRSLALVTNSGPSGVGDGGAFGPFEWDTLASYTSATTSPDGGDLTGHYSADVSTGVFLEHTWYAYSLEGNHKLWPNYRVYLVHTDPSDDQAPVYAVQIISYYGEDGTSGQPVIRWKQVALTDGEVR